jgi:hypothetical protein
LYELKTLRKTSENYRRARGNRRDVTQAQEEQAWRPPRCCIQLMLPKYDAALQISKLKLAGNAAKHQEKLWKISVHAQKISSQQ